MIGLDRNETKTNYDHTAGSPTVWRRAIGAQVWHIVFKATGTRDIEIHC